MELIEIDKIPLVALAIGCSDEEVFLKCKMLSKNNVVHEYLINELEKEETAYMCKAFGREVINILNIKKDMNNLVKFIKSFYNESGKNNEIIILKLLAVGYKNPKEPDGEAIVEYKVHTNKSQLIELKEFYQYKRLVDCIDENKEKLLSVAKNLYEAAKICYMDNNISGEVASSLA